MSRYITSWRGKPIEDCEKDDLLEIIDHALDLGPNSYRQSNGLKEKLDNVITENKRLWTVIDRLTRGACTTYLCAACHKQLGELIEATDQSAKRSEDDDAGARG